MNNFKLIGHFDPEEVETELKQTKLWNWLNLRRLTEVTYHSDIDDIVLRFQPIQGYTRLDQIYHENYCVDYFIQQFLPKTCQVIIDFAQNRPMGRVLVASMQPGSQIGTHIDEGNYAKNHDRYHLVITSNEHTQFTSGDEIVIMRPGTIWWFNNMIPHSVYNNGSNDRIHIIVDLLKENNDKDPT